MGMVVEVAMVVVPCLPITATVAVAAVVVMMVVVGM